jgi:hypothetical protein
MIIDEFLDQYTTIEMEKAIREGIDPMGGNNSPMRVPGQNKQKTLERSPSPKKLLHKINNESPTNKRNFDMRSPQRKSVL